MASACALFACACGHQNARAKEPVVPAAKTSDEVAQLRAEIAERDRRLNQLENRLALIEAEQRQHRYTLESLTASEAQPGIRETVRISAPPQDDSALAAEPPKAREPRPVLRLYEQSTRTSSAPLMSVPEVNEKLPRFVPTLSADAKAPLAAEDLYRLALDLVRKRDFDNALVALNDFLVRYPDDPRAPRALYWRGEVLFAQRDYARALAAFETSLAREPEGEKAPDAWLRVSRCHLRLGEKERAKDALERLKTQFPNSDAARLAAQEDA